MAGVALMEGLPSRNSEVQHVSLLTIDHAGVSYFDYCGSNGYSQLNYDADYDFGFYWPVPASRILALKTLFAQLLELPRGRIKFVSEKNPPLPPSVTAAAFKAIVQGDKAPPVYMSCVTLLTNALICAGIPCPFVEDIGQVSRTRDVRTAARVAAPISTQWHRHASGLVWRCPNQYTDYDAMTGRLMEALYPAAPRKILANA